jgi:hypothetical protein
MWQRVEMKQDTDRVSLRDALGAVGMSVLALSIGCLFVIIRALLQINI